MLLLLLLAMPPSCGDRSNDEANPLDRVVCLVCGFGDRLLLFRGICEGEREGERERECESE